MTTDPTGPEESIIKALLAAKFVSGIKLVIALPY